MSEALFEDLSAADVARLFPATFNQNLRELIAAIVGEALPRWRRTVEAMQVRAVAPVPCATLAASTYQCALRAQISLPKLEDFDWRVDVKASADAMMRMNVPTVLVQLKLRDMPTRVGDMPGSTSVTFELTRETLDTMLDGLSKIRDQLASVAAE